MKMTDLKGLSKSYNLKIDSVDNPSGRYYIVNMSAPVEMHWEAGEHGIFSLPDRKINQRKKFRPFSVASIPEENKLILGIKTGSSISSFKEELISMKKGERVKVRGPFGWFKIQNQNSPMVLLANGVGITPIRALLKKLEYETSRPIDVIYTSRDYHLFREDFDSIAEKNDAVTIHYVFDRSESAFTLEELIKKHHNRAYYYISGGTKMIKETKNNLKQQQINAKRIITDSFSNY